MLRTCCDPTARIATFNLLHGMGLRSGTAEPAALSAAARAVGADLIGLQEVDRHQERSGGGGGDDLLVAAHELPAAAQRSRGPRVDRLQAEQALEIVGELVGGGVTMPRVRLHRLVHDDREVAHRQVARVELAVASDERGEDLRRELAQQVPTARR